MAELRVQIVRYVDDGFPGFVACEFTDATGQQHTIVDKVPIVSVEDLDASSQYPRPGAVPCSILETMRRENGVPLLRITTREPVPIDTVNGQSEFVVLASEVHDER